MSLPHAPQAPAPTAGPVHPVPVAPHRRILLVDDMPAIHEDFRKILGPRAARPAEDDLDALEAALFASDQDDDAITPPSGGAAAAGFELDSAHQGREALQRVQQAVAEGRPYALAFVDMRMPPGWDGAQTIAHLWQADPALQVVICTAYSDDAWEDVLDRLAAQDRLLILKKPFDPIEVAQLAHTLTAKWQAARQVARHTQALEEEVHRRTAELQRANLQLQAELAERERREAELQLAASVFRNALNGIVVTDEHSLMLSVNPAFTTLTGYEAGEAVGRKLSLLSSDHHPPGHYREQWNRLLATGHWSGELWNRRKDGSLFCEWLSLSRVPVPAGQPARYVGILADVTERRRMDEHFRHLALHDPLTGLANRAQLLERLEQALAHAQRKGQSVALLFIDLDRFKPVNDTLGHDVGDALLRAVAERLKALIRQGDTAARLGGDEFVLLLEGLPRLGDTAEQAAERALHSLGQPIAIGPHRLTVGASVGLACGPDDGADAATLMRRADLAMYAAKNAGRQCWRRHQAGLPTLDDPASAV